MELQIRSNGTKITTGMRDYIDAKMTKLDKMVNNVVDAQLELRTEKTRSGIDQTSAQLTLHTGKHVLRAEVHDAEATRAIDQAIDKLERQVRKFKDKRKDHKSRTGVSNLSLAIADANATMEHASEDDIDDDEGSESRLVRTKRFSMKPMAVEEAIDQLELIGHDFYLFLNSDEEQLNVLYRRRDGSYGLLGPNPM